MTKKESIKSFHIPILPVRDKVVFPTVQVSLVVGRERSMQAIRRASSGSRLVFVVAQRHLKVEEPQRKDLFEYGTVAEVIQSLGSPEGLLRIRVVGRHRAKLLDFSLDNNCLMGDVQTVETVLPEGEDPKEIEALRRTVVRKFEEYTSHVSRISSDVVADIVEETSLEKMMDRVCDALFIGVDEKQDLLETLEIPKRLNRLAEVLNSEIEILHLEKRIQGRVHRQIEKSQKDYYLNEQMRAIQKELKKKDEFSREIEDLKTQVKELKMPASVH